MSNFNPEQSLYSADFQAEAEQEKSRLSQEEIFQTLLEEQMVAWTEARTLAELTEEELLAYATQHAWSRLVEWLHNLSRDEDARFAAVIAWRYYNTDHYPLFSSALEKITNYIFTHNIDGSTSTH
jgi:hypothetical protein